MMIPMSFDAQLNHLFMKWKQLQAEGQSVSAEELCAEEGITDPAILKALEERIRSSQGESEITSTTGTNDPTYIEPLGMEESPPQVPEETPIDQQASSAETTVQYSSSSSQGPTRDEVIFGHSRYDNFRLLAQGGLGEIYAASERELARDVALKFIHSRHAADANRKNQFIVEGEVTARLEHPGVVPIYGLGSTSGGRPFFVMRLIRGETLEQRIEHFHRRVREGCAASEQSVEFRKLLGQFFSVCNTVAYAHNRGILHRDIKPDNIMLGKYGETLVVDWGLALSTLRDDYARASGEETLMPGSGDTDSDFVGGVVGTPWYMSPEQADGRQEVDTATDIYGLGATLYKLLTGQTAIQGTQLVRILDKVKHGDFRPPHTVDPAVPRALDAVCLRAMALKPNDRYSSALDMAADIESWLADEPVAAYEEPWRLKALRWARHHRGLTQAVVAIMLAVLVATTAVITTRWNQHELLVAQKLDGLRSRAGIEEAMLASDFRALEQDVQFLGTRPQIIQVATASDANDASAEKLVLNTTFHEFIRRKPSYMQARLIGKNGVELVRVERTEPGGAVQQAEKLRDKSKSSYFTNTMLLSEGEVYLSKLELNVEDGAKDWDFPVIRAAVPVFGPAGQRHGIVVINMHFSHLADLVQKSQTDNLLVYLTNDQGQFLLHPTAGIGFCFERELDYPIEAVYPKLAMFLLSADSTEIDIDLREVKPIVSLLVEPMPSTDLNPKTLLSLVAAIVAEHPTVDPRFSEDKDRVILKGIPGDQLNRICEQMNRDLDGQCVVQPLPPKFEGSEQAVYCRKIFFDLRQPERFLTLVLALP